MDENLGFLNEIPYLKNNLLQTFLNDDVLMRLVGDAVPLSLPALNLRCKRVFPWEYVWGTTEDSVAYLTFEINASALTTYGSTAKNPAVKNLELNVFCFCHDKINLVDDKVGTRLGIEQRGSRVDLMTARIDELINGAPTSSFGEWEFQEIESILPVATHFPGKRVTYTSQNFNRWGSRL